METYEMSCEMCGKCCRNHTIFLLIQDLQEIDRYYPEKDIFSSISFYESPHNMTAELRPILNFPQIEIFENNQLIKGYLGLRFYHPLPHEVNYRVCPYLNDSNNQCTIHAHNPMICHGYPYNLDSDQKIRWDGERCASRWGETTKIPSMIASHLHKFVIELEKHKEWVAEWNKKPSAEKIFDNFRLFVLNLETDK
jgi:Fe-S-cluster containining protein